jgi:hypothetical protein
MTRRVSKMLGAASLVLFALIAVAWIFTRNGSVLTTCRVGTHFVYFRAWESGITVDILAGKSSDDPVGVWCTSGHKIWLHSQAPFVIDPDPVYLVGPGAMQNSRDRGFGFITETGRMAVVVPPAIFTMASPLRSYAGVFVEWPLVVFLPTVFPLIWLAGILYRRHIESRRAALLSQGRCPACGYDLRASPNRCPECGAEKPINELKST